MVSKSVDDNLRVAAAFEEAFNACDWPRLQELLTETIVIYDPASPEPIEGEDAAISVFMQNVDYFPSRTDRECPAFRSRGFGVFSELRDRRAGRF